MNSNCTNTPVDLLHDLLLGMGKVQGVLETIQRCQKEQSKLMGKLDERLRTVERKAALNGLLAGGMVGVVVGVLGHFFKNYFSLRG